jgi:hypothetical protein
MSKLCYYFTCHNWLIKVRGTLFDSSGVRYFEKQELVPGTRLNFYGLQESDTSQKERRTGSLLKVELLLKFLAGAFRHPL